MQLQLGDLLHSLRVEQNLEARQVYAGICSKSNMFYYENNQRTLDNLMFERLVERMGLSSERFSFMISEEEYIYRQWQEEVYVTIEQADWEKTEQLLKHDIKGNGWVNKKLQNQFYHYAKGVYEGSKMNYESALKELKTAAEYTISDEVEQKKMVLLNSMEIHILILIMFYGCKGNYIDAENRKELFYYLESLVYDGILDLEEKAQTYPKLICCAMHCMENQLTEREWCMFCERAVDILRNNHSFHDITELLRRYLPLLKNAKSKEYGFYKKHYEVFCDLLQEENIDTGFRSEVQGVRKPKLYLTHEYFLSKRQEKNLTQETLCDGICEPETYSRIEGGKRAPSRKNYVAIADKLDIQWVQYRGEINSNHLKAYRLRTKERIANIEGRWEENLAILHELEQVLDMSLVENHQYIKYNECVSKSRLGIVKLEDAGEELIALLSLTQKRNSNFSDLVYYSQTEMEIIAHLAQIYRKLGKYADGIKLLEEMIKQMSHSKLGFEYQWNGFSLVFRVLSGLYFAIGNYDNSIKISEYVKHTIIQRKEASNLPEVLDAIADDWEHKGEQYSEEYKKLYRHTYYVADFFGIKNIKDFGKKYYEEKFDADIVWYEDYSFEPSF